MALEISNELFIYNRTILTRILKSQAPPRAVVLLKGAVGARPLYNTSICHPFQQQPFFNWVFGVEEPGFYGLIDIATEHTYLFAPEYHKECEICQKPSLTFDEIKIKYAVDACFNVNSLKSVLIKLKPKVLLTLCGKSFKVKLDESDATFLGIEQFNVNMAALFPILSLVRLQKSDFEINFLLAIYKLVDKGLNLVIQKTHPGMYDYQIEAIFKAVCLFEGNCRQCACDILPTTYCRPRKFRDGDMVVLNLRAKHSCYKIDITQSFPANGKFTKLQADIYNAVYESHEALINFIKSNVRWIDLSMVSNMFLLLQLKRYGLLVGNLEDMMKVQLAAVFRGKDVVTLLDKDISLMALHRMDLQSTINTNMVLAVESSCYFVDKKIASALADPRRARFFVPAMVKHLNNSYNVCLKSNVVVLSDGCQYFSQPKNLRNLEWLYSYKGQDQ